MFYAERGKGAFMNGRGLRVSHCTGNFHPSLPICFPSELHNALILTDWGGDRNASNLDTKAANIRRLISEARGFVLIESYFVLF